MKRLFLLLAAITMLATNVITAQTTPEAPVAAATEAVATEAAEAAATLNTGDTAWMITATVLVLFMTLPGLALFYGGLVRSKNILTVLVQCFALAAIVTVLWVVFGYSMAFDTAGMTAGAMNFNTFVGGCGIRHLSIDVCHHHARVNCRCVCGTDEVFGDVDFHSDLVRLVLPADLPHGVGG
jgi:hypothetical protein